MDKILKEEQGGLGGLWKLCSRKINLPGIFAWLTFAFLFAPSLIVIPISFGSPYEIIFPPREFRFDLYVMFFTTSNWLAVTMRSFEVALLSTALALILGTLAAYAIERSHMRGKQLLLILLLSPLLIPTVVIALGLYSYFAAAALSGSMTALVVGHTVLLCPFVIVTVSAGIIELDINVEVAASVMGASRLKIFSAVVLPQLGPSMLTAGLFCFLMSFDELVVSWFISSLETMTLPVKMYSSVQAETSPILAAVSTLLTIVSVLICIFAEFTRRRWKDKRRG